MWKKVVVVVYQYGASRIRHNPLDAAVTHNITGTGNTSPPKLEARERIRDAAIELFGEHGFNEVSLKEIACRAGVSAPLVIHHYESKRNLRKVCDAFVTEQIRRTKTESVRIAGPMPRNHALELIQSHRHLLKYLLQAFAAGGPEMDDLFDTLVEDSLEYTAEAEQLGLVYPSTNPRHRAVVLLLQSFGALMLHHQMKRHLGASPLDEESEGLLPYMAAVAEIYTRPLMNAEMYRELMESQQAFEREISDASPP
ncbi:TetR family transcriptional regulator [Nesterenkonia haasae]|uniref:TetR family transcriptional regulator n=1 Tax=Nesterenkonia haasae TaxID=2587813 RepID=UPI001F245386|nr:TetR family transcriptional regulator [Nesterenkonia haasae]NDK32689.1 TetR/AcrR family transcriptional regulator [Nesterenkonia haasae]